MASTHVTSASSVFGEGKLKVESVIVKPFQRPHPPKSLFVTYPKEEGEYPVLLFFHGTSTLALLYKQLLLHISSHGFIVVAPQLHIIPFKKDIEEDMTESSEKDTEDATKSSEKDMEDATKQYIDTLQGTDKDIEDATKAELFTITRQNSKADIEDAIKVTNWLPDGLKLVLPPGVKANLDELALGGHSRGGHTAFSIALGYGPPSSLKFSALIGVDPVAGTSESSQLEPKILTENESFKLSIPVMVIGSGLGQESIMPPMPACAPKGVNHWDFYKRCQPSCCHFVVEGFGHMDMLDDNAEAEIMGSLCKGGESREPMRRSVGGLVVAFLKAYLKSDKGDLRSIVHEHKHIAPAVLNPAELREKEK
ncbi:hypothetical protein QJS04_geneDACA004245 [Acorus gramineus]|uniref:Chlorophyllase n=1 Tax=Acorus gramineus TaxID=55184 RepID=A0AAV9B3T9_ACOGR|nr:hypothetical protein QJS04_geneDACA004245 [Acorus gramineus]